MPDIKIGWAQTSITPDRPVFHSGQIYPAFPNMYTTR